MVRFSEGLAARGVLKAGEALLPDDRAVRISARSGKRTTVDGPFVEAKEVVGGFFVLDCATMEEAVAIGAECPATAWATVEVREVAPCYHGAA